MDRITAALLNEFKAESAVQGIDNSEAFELFGNFCAVSSEYQETFDVHDVWTGGGNDTGIDGIAIIVNGSLITTADELLDLANRNNYLDIDFIFVQSKTSSRFSSGEIGTFFFGIQDFFSEKPRLPRNEKIRESAEIQIAAYNNAALFRRRKPRLTAYYITTGKWEDDVGPGARASSESSDLVATGLFENVEFKPVDADELQRLYRSTKNKVSVEINFEHKTVLPEIAGVRESYLGILPASEYLKLIVDDNNNIRKSLFYDNVRDWQGANAVNQEIAETITSGRQDQFIVLNNGITIVAQAVTPIGNRFNISDYQIVNGCQTSHVLFNNRSGLHESLWVPVKVIVTQDDEITRRIIKATNRQSQIKEDELRALADFQKKLEEFYNSFEPPHRLYYERRSKQYNDAAGTEKVRIVTIGTQIRAFASMFLDQAYRASRYYTTLLDDVGDNIFSDRHQPIGYYVAAYANYKLDSLFRNGYVDSKYRPFRYHILAVARIRAIAGGSAPFHTREFERQCNGLKDILWDDDACIRAFVEATGIVEDVVGAELDRDKAKVQSLAAEIGRLAIDKPRQ